MGDLERDLGNIAKLSKADANTDVRPIPFYGDYRTPIDGLYLCGGGTHPGGGVMGVPGRNASVVVLEDARRADARARVRGWLGR